LHPVRPASGRPRCIDLEAIQPYLHLPLRIAAAHLDISVSALKRVRQKLGMARWGATEGATTRGAAAGTAAAAAPIIERPTTAGTKVGTGNDTTELTGCARPEAASDTRHSTAAPVAPTSGASVTAPTARIPASSPAAGELERPAAAGSSASVLARGTSSMLNLRQQHTWEYSGSSVAPSATRPSGHAWTAPTARIPASSPAAGELERPAAAGSSASVLARGTSSMLNLRQQHPWEYSGSSVAPSATRPSGHASPGDLGFGAWGQPAGVLPHATSSIVDFGRQHATHFLGCSIAAAPASQPFQDQAAACDGTSDFQALLPLFPHAGNRNLLDARLPGSSNALSHLASGSFQDQLASNQLDFAQQHTGQYVTQYPALCGSSLGLELCPGTLSESAASTFFFPVQPLQDQALNLPYDVTNHSRGFGKFGQYPIFWDEALPTAGSSSN